MLRERAETNYATTALGDHLHNNKVMWHSIIWIVLMKFSSHCGNCAMWVRKIPCTSIIDARKKNFYSK